MGSNYKTHGAEVKKNIAFKFVTVTHKLVARFVASTVSQQKKALSKIAESLDFIMVGTARFELATTCPPDKCATRLRYAPAKQQREIITSQCECQQRFLMFCKIFPK